MALEINAMSMSLIKLWLRRYATTLVGGIVVTFAAHATGIDSRVLLPSLLASVLVCALLSLSCVKHWLAVNGLAASGSCLAAGMIVILGFGLHIFGLALCTATLILLMAPKD